MKRALDKLIIFIIGCAYSFIILYSIASILYDEAPVDLILLLSAGSYLLFNLLLSNKIGRIVCIVTLAGMCLWVGYLLLTRQADSITQEIDRILILWEKLLFYDFIEPIIDLHAAKTFVIFGAFVISPFVFYLFAKKLRFVFITAAALAAHLFAWVMTAKEFKGVFIMFCILTLLSYIRNVYEKKRKKGLMEDAGMAGSLMFFSIPLVLVLIFFIMRLPKNEAPIQWPWMDQKIISIVNYFEQRFAYSDIEFFSLSTTGFNDRSSILGGVVRPSNTIVMDVTASERVYLRGAAYDWYEDNQWFHGNNYLNYDNAMRIENNLDVEETTYAFQLMAVDRLFPDLNQEDGEMIQQFSSGQFNDLLYPTKSLHVRYRNMATRSMFLPLKTKMPITDSRAEVMPVSENIDGIVLSNEKLEPGAEYSLEYTQPLYGEPILKKALTLSRAGLYRDAYFDLITNDTADNDYAVDQTASENNEPSFSFYDKMQALEILMNRAQTLRDQYTLLSDGITDRVRALAYDITKDSTNDYEKALAIEKYLRENSVYTLTPGRMREGYDFVDWFLFENNKGYCTYTATAMTVLLRCNGIPARYVEGYVLPEKPSKDNIYVVTNRYAHAWVEAYFEGFGWIPFEPTAIYSDVLNYRTTPESVQAYSGGMPFDMEGMMDRYRSRDDIPGYVPTLPDKELQTANDDSVKVSPFLIIAYIVAVYALVNLLLILIRYVAWRRMNKKKKVYYLFKTIFKGLNAAGYKIKPGETALEFAVRIDMYFIINPHTMVKATQIFSKVRYGGAEVDADELAVILNVYNQIRRGVLKEIGIKRYMPLRLVILGF